MVVTYVSGLIVHFRLIVYCITRASIRKETICNFVGYCKRLSRSLFNMRVPYNCLSKAKEKEGEEQARGSPRACVSKLLVAT